MKNFSDIQWVHCVGIGGIGLSALAQYFLATGRKVSGTDGVESDLTRYLESKGVVFSTVQDGGLISHQVIKSSSFAEASVDRSSHQVGDKKSKILRGARSGSAAADNDAELNAKIPNTHPDLIVYSPAIPASNGDLKRAKELGIPMLTYPEALGKLTSEKVTIAVCGTHGKSTTTAMISLMMVAAGMDPTVIIGTKVREFGENVKNQKSKIKNQKSDVGTNFRYGKSEFLVIEACEYKDSFLQYFPHIIVCPNVDVDHLDYFKTEERYRDSFRRFFKSLPHTGYLVGEQAISDKRLAISGDKKKTKDQTPKTKLETEKKGIEDLIVKMKGSFAGVVFGENTFTFGEKEYEYPKVGVPGRHNRTNAALTFVTGKILNIPESVILDSIAKFSGTWRRFERRGTINGAVVIDDYGHHPTEIAATLEAAREGWEKKNPKSQNPKIPKEQERKHQTPNTKHQTLEASQKSERLTLNANRLIVVYQPHQYSRTKIFLTDFGKAFHDADLVIVPNIYQARNDDPIISAQDLVDEIMKNGTEAMDGGGLEKTAQWVNENVKKGDVVITMGAGNIDGIYRWLKVE